MKKAILLSYSLFVALGGAFISPASAQITLGKSDFPSSGKIYNLSTARRWATMDATLTGANYTWDYTALDTLRTGVRVDTFFTVAQTAQLYALYFAFGAHASNQAVVGNDFALGTYLKVTNAYNFFNNSSSSYNQTGFGANISFSGGPAIPTPIGYSPQDLVYKYPVAFGNIDSSNSAYNISLSAIYYGVNMVRHNEVDGWGTLITPYGTFNVLRLKSTIVETDTFHLDTLVHFGQKLPPTTRVEYKWLGAGRGEPLLQINMTGTAVTSIAFMDSLHVGVLVMDKPLQDFIVFPNPAVDKALLHYSLSTAADVHIEIMDMSGAVVLTKDEKKQTAGEHLTTVELPATVVSSGDYLVRVTAGNAQLIKPLVIAK